MHFPLLAVVTGTATGGNVTISTATPVLTGGKVINTRISGNLKGDVLILSVNRVPFSTGAFFGTVAALVQTAQDCEDHCSVVSGCQGWSYCSPAEGCGSGCKAYHEKTGPRKLSQDYFHGHVWSVAKEQTYVSIENKQRA